MGEQEKAGKEAGMKTKVAERVKERMEGWRGG